MISLQVQDPRDYDPPIVKPDTAEQIIPYILFGLRCLHCYHTFYVLGEDEAACPVCGEDDCKEENQRDVDICVNQYTGDVHIRINKNKGEKQYEYAGIRYR